ncbi:MAG TPA: CRTAC1 family protein [Candidatus Polarisedimenticolia bacterium]|nr:CRTAC1 family protein [Candidatus Polarisedimenticolia bacterium]
MPPGPRRRPRLPAVLAAAGLAAASSESGSAIRFRDAAESAGITFTSTNGNPERNFIVETIGSGAAFLDFDLDGDLDLYLANGATLEPPGARRPTGALYRNDGRGRFEDVTAGSGLEIPFWGFGAAAGDYDADGDPDLYVTAWGPNRLFRNEGKGRFHEVGAAAGVDDPRFGASAAFFDYDNDGALDLFAANYVTFDPARVPAKGDPNSPCTFRGLSVMCGPHGLPGSVSVLYRNNGDGTFSDVTRDAGLFTEGTYYGLGVVTVDLEKDGLQEILVANDSTPNHLYRNLGGGRFEDTAVMSGFAYSNDGREQAGMGIAASDIEGDGDVDVLITNFSHDYTTLRLNDGNGFLEDVSMRIGLAEKTLATLGWGTAMLDLDHDGDLDMVIANGHVYPEVEEADIGTTYRQRIQIFESAGPLALKEVLPRPDDPAGGALERAEAHRSLAVGDVDGDGDLDLLATVLDGKPRLLLNESDTGAWLGVRLAGRRSNRDGVGAKVTVEAGGRRWSAERQGGGSFLSASDPRLHFGLGSAARVDAVTVTWPSGLTQRVGPVETGLYVTLVEPGQEAGKPASGKSLPP